MLSLALLAGLVAYPAAATERFPGALGAAGVAGCVALALGLVFRASWLIGCGVAFFGAEYAAFLRLRGGAVDARSVYVAVGLLLVAELAFFSIQVRVPAADRALSVRRVATMVAALVGTGFAGGLVLVISGSAGGGVAVEALGALAAVLAVAFVVRVASHSRESTST